MVVGVLTGELHFYENHSLKGKRIILRKILDRVKRKFNVSAAEVDFQDLWQRSMIAVACVNTSAREANATLSQVLNVLDTFHEAELINHVLEMR